MLKYICMGATVILLLAMSALAQSVNYPASPGNVDDEPPVCYMEQADGITLDLSRICGKSNPSNAVIGPNGRSFVPVRSPRSEGCACPYDIIDEEGKSCGARSVYAEGSPVCYRPVR